MWDWLIIFLDDFKKATLEINLNELVRPGFFILWLIILAMPLKDVDRRDPVAGLMYVLFSTFAGACLMFSIPQHIVDDLEPKAVLIGTLIMGTISCCRWFLRPELFIEKDLRNVGKPQG